MRRVFCGLFLCLTTVSSIAQPDAVRDDILKRMNAIPDDSESPALRLRTFIDLNFEYTMNEFPEFATFIGHPTGHDRWTDDSMTAVHRREREARQALETLRSIPRDELDGEDLLNFDLLLERLESGVEAQRFGGNYIALTQLSGPQQSIARMMQMMPAATMSDYQNILARLNTADAPIRAAVRWMRAGLEAGVTPPAVTLRDVPDQVSAQIFDDPMASPLLVKFQRFPATFSEEDKAGLITSASAAYRDEIVPALRELRTFLVEEYLPGARESIAMSALPDGESWYAFNVRQRTTTGMSPREIHEIGLSEVARIRGEMEKIKTQTGFEGSLEEFFDFLRTDPQFFFTDPEDLLVAYRDISKRADPGLVRLFGNLPRQPYGVEPVPAYAEKSQTTAYYQRGSIEAGRPGIFFANTYALDTRPKWEMEALTLHEAVPGHHLQIAIQSELTDIAWFRRFGGYTAFTEGWGLYAESLGEEMGFYQDPYSKFGQLTYEMWRAIRLVVDTGMHSLGWTRDEAIDYFRNNSGKSEHDIVVEIDRYIVWPGQALAYKIGELKIKELRARAEEKLGDAFDIRAFHDELLGSGALPLTVLESRIDEWIAGQL